MNPQHHHADPKPAETPAQRRLRESTHDLVRPAHERGMVGWRNAQRQTVAQTTGTNQAK